MARPVKEACTIKTVYIRDVLLEQMQEGVRNFNFSQRSNDLIDLGLNAEKALSSMGIASNMKDERFIQRMNELIQLGMKVEQEKENSITLRACIEFLVKMYNAKHTNQPIKC